MRIRKFLGLGVFLVVIALSIMDLMQVADGEIRLFKELLSWILIGYFIYSSSPTKTFFNNKHKKVDLFILIALYFFAVKNLVYLVSKEHMMYLDFIKTFFFTYGIDIQIYTLQIGAILLGIMALYLGWKHEYMEDSILGYLRKKSTGKWYDKIIDIIIIYIIFILFSYFIFTILMEWFVMVLDSYFIGVAIIYYFIYYFFIKKRRGFVMFIESVVNTGSNFLKLFLNLFQDKKTIFLGISGIIVIHGIVDIVNFIFPYLFTISNLYLAKLPPGTHQSLVNLLLADFAGADLIGKISISYIYLMNVVAIFFILALPFYIWLKMLNKKEITFSIWPVAVFFSSLICFIFAPVLKFSALEHIDLAGADITTNSLSIANPGMIALISILWFVIMMVLGSLDSIKRKAGEMIVIPSIVFLGIYIYYFYSSTLKSLIGSIQGLLDMPSLWLIALIMAVYLVSTTLFYIGGFLLFMLEIMGSEHFSFTNLSMNIQKKALFIWSLVLFVGLIYLININKIMDLSILLITSLILSLALLRYEKTPARYILMTNLVIIALLLVMPVMSLLNIHIDLMAFLSRMALLVLVIILMAAFKFWFSFKLSWKRILIAIVLGILFGYWFYILKEPGLPLLFDNLGYIIFLSLLVALNEELIFRFLLLKVSTQLYSVNFSVIILGVFFGLLHLMNFQTFLTHLGPVMLGALFVSLVLFGIAMGLLSVGKEGKINPVYAIICHTIAVVLLNVLPFSWMS